MLEGALYVIVKSSFLAEASGGVNSEDWEARASTKTVSINLANYKPSDKKYL